MSVEDRYLPTTLGRVHVQVAGEGPAVMFWPSLLMNGSMWRAYLEHFRGTRRVVVVDPPGHGASEPLTHAFSFDDCVSCVIDILDGLDIDVVDVVGNSWGAMIGATFTAGHPDRVRSAVLMNGTASPARLAQKIQYAFLTGTARLLGSIRPPLLRSVLAVFTGPTTRRTRPEVMTAIRGSLAQVNIESARWAVTSVVPRRPDQRPLLAGISRPVLVVAGAEDATFPVQEVREMAGAIPGAGFAVLDGVAHLAALESPDAVIPLIEAFLAEQE